MGNIEEKLVAELDDDFLNLSEKHILVTGASSGIGKETAIKLSRQGAKLVITGRDKLRLSQTYEQLQGTGHTMVVADLVDFSSYDTMFQSFTHNSKLSGMVHCAGIGKPVPIKVISEKIMKEIFDINFFSFVFLVKYFLKRKYSEGGNIVAVSSLNAHKSDKCFSLYAASKAALEVAVKNLAFDLIDKNIRINCVVPGPVSTPMYNEGLERYKGSCTQATVGMVEERNLGLGTPEQIANVILFLLSDSSSFVTGQSYFVDGGRLV